MTRLIIVGINTDVGKTVAACLIAEALEAYYWKPIQCGYPRDSEWVDRMLSQKNKVLPENFILQSPCSPHLAARIEGQYIHANDFVLPAHRGSLVVEGAGGILSPLNETEYWVDAAMQWDAQWILVHRHYLGSLNHFNLTIEAIRQRDIPLAGIVFNGEGDLPTEEMLLKKANTPCLGRLPWLELFSPQILQNLAKIWKPSLQKTLGLHETAVAFGTHLPKH